jgi:hypothetical protein
MLIGIKNEIFIYNQNLSKLILSHDIIFLYFYLIH